MIRQIHRFQFSISLLFLAYAYLVTGYSAAAVFFGIASFLTALLFHSAGTLYRNLNQILISALIQAVMIRWSGLEQSFPQMLVLAVLNAAVSVLWLSSSRKAIRETMQVLLLASASLLVLELVLPEAVTSCFAGLSRCSVSEACLMILLMFGPILIPYGLKQGVILSLKRKHRSLIMSQIPSQGAGDYDGMAGKALYKKQG
ncbi:MAG: hypothetical protein ACI4WR_06590 [Bulleidia sp.]